MKTLVGYPEPEYNYRNVPLWALPQIRAIADHWTDSNLVVVSFTPSENRSHGYLTVRWPQASGTTQGELFKDNMNDPTSAILQFKLTATWKND